MGASSQIRLAPLVRLRLVAHAAERQGGGDRVEGGLADRNADHGGNVGRAPLQTSPSARTCSTS